jgi:hypothetical protein
VDVRTDSENDAGAIPGSVLIPINDLRERIEEVRGKELMVHQLNRDGFLNDVMMDRGVITNSVWGILNGRVKESQVLSEINYMIENGLFKNTIFFLILGTHSEERSKDVWDHMDIKIPEEMSLFIKLFEYISERGVRTHVIQNKFDASSLSDFQTLIKNLK